MSASIESKAQCLLDISELVKRSVQTKFSLYHHHTEGESHFIESLQAIIKEDPILEQHDHAYTYRLSVVRIYVIPPMCSDGTPQYPQRARWTDSDYVARTMVDMTFEVLEHGDFIMDADQRLLSPQNVADKITSSSNSLRDNLESLRGANIVKHFASFTVSAGEIFVGVQSELCNIKRCGQPMVHEDPRMPPGYHIVGGRDKVTEAQFVVRGNFPYVHFHNSCTSQSQSATASEASMSDSTTADSPIVLSCDFRPVNDLMCKFGAAFHTFLTVQTPRLARRCMESRMRKSPYDAEAFCEASSPSIELERGVEGLYNYTNSQIPSCGYYGNGESIVISFPNIANNNFNLVLIMFLLGHGTRHQMIESIIGEEVHVLKSEGILINDNDKGYRLVDFETLSTKLKQSNNQYLRHAYIIYNELYAIFHNQSLFPPNMTCNPSVIMGDYDIHHLCQSEQKEISTVRRFYQNICNQKYPFVGCDDSGTNVTTKNQNNSDCGSFDRSPDINIDQTNWCRPDNFYDDYNTQLLDGWSRPAVLAHVAQMMHSSQKKRWDQFGLPPAPYQNTKRAKKTSSSTPSAGHHHALQELESKLSRFSKSFVEELFPNLGKGAHWRVIVSKSAMLCHVMKKVVLVYMGYVSPDNIDMLEMKRIQTPGHMMMGVYRNAFTKGIHKMFKNVVGQYQGNIQSKTNSNDTSSQGTIINWDVASEYFAQTPFATAMTKGIWPRGGATVMDVRGSTKSIQIVNAATIMESGRKIHTVMNKKGATRLKDNAAQQLNDTHHGMIDPIRTFNDNQAGIDVHLAQGSSRVRIGYQSSALLMALMRGAKSDAPFLKNFFHRLHAKPRSTLDCTEPTSHLMQSSVPYNNVPIFINGIMFGYTPKPNETMSALKYARIRGAIPYDVSLTWIGGPLAHNPNNPMTNCFFNYIHVSGDWGALMCPFIDMSNLWKLPIIAFHFSSLVSKGVYPNLGLLPLVLEYAHLAPHPNDDVSLINLIYILQSKENSRIGAPSEHDLFDMLLNEGVLVFRDTEELKQEYICPSVDDLSPHLHDYIIESYANYWNHFENLKNGIIQNMPDLRTMISNTLQRSSTQRFINSNGRPRESIRWTLLRISDELSLGVTSSLIPFINSNDAVRSSYSTGMRMQSTSVISLNHKWKKNPYQLSAMEPRTTMNPNSLGALYCAMGSSSSAFPSLTAFLPTAWNGEDGIQSSASVVGKYDIRHEIIHHTNAIAIPDPPIVQQNANSDSITSLHKGHIKANIVIEPEDVSINKTIFLHPQRTRCITLKSSSYKGIEENGTPRIGALIRPSEAIIGTVVSSGSKEFLRDSSKTNKSRMTLRVDEYAKINGVRGHQGGSTIQLYTRASAVKTQEDADKYATFPGQKGVIGKIGKRYDVPYVIDKNGRGMIPEFFRGANGVPSRATVSEYYEMAKAQECLNEGRIGIVNSWGAHRNMAQRLRHFGPNFGTHKMSSGMTGQTLEHDIAVGWLDFGSLMHEGRRTFNSRQLGAIDPRTEQPTEGGKKTGGAREGEQEMLNKTSQGATEVAEQLLFSGADPGIAHICAICGLMGDSSRPAFLAPFIDAYKTECSYLSKRIKMIVGTHSLSDSSLTEDDKTNHDTKSLTTHLVKRFARSNRILQNLSSIHRGQIIDCIERRLVLYRLLKVKQSLGLRGNMIRPGGGFCKGCDRADTVFAVKVPRVVPQLLENIHLAGLAWRMILDVSRNQGDLAPRTLIENIKSYIGSNTSSQEDDYQNRVSAIIASRLNSRPTILF